jgi:hypothetical protein
VFLSSLRERYFFMGSSGALCSAYAHIYHEQTNINKILACKTGDLNGAHG